MEGIPGGPASLVGRLYLRERFCTCCNLQTEPGALIRRKNAKPVLSIALLLVVDNFFSANELRRVALVLLFHVSFLSSPCLRHRFLSIECLSLQAELKIYFRTSGRIDRKISERKSFRDFSLERRDWEKFKVQPTANEARRWRDARSGGLASPHSFSPGRLNRFSAIFYVF